MAAYRSLRTAIFQHGALQRDRPFLHVFNQLAYLQLKPKSSGDRCFAAESTTLPAHQLSQHADQEGIIAVQKTAEPAKFSARLLCQRSAGHRTNLALSQVPCVIRFWDENGGAAYGEIELAALNIP